MSAAEPDASTGWTADQLRRIDDSRELEIAVERRDGRRGRYTPIWVVTVADGVYVRTWHRRSTGWYGHVVDTGRARIRVDGLASEVVVTDLGADDDRLRAAVDDAYRAKYAPRGSTSVAGMVGEEAAATTLRLAPSPAAGG